MKKIYLILILLLLSTNAVAEEFVFDTGTGSSIHFDDEDNITIKGADGEWHFENNGKYFGPNAQLAYQIPFATDTNYFITGIGTFGHDKYCNGKLPEARIFPATKGRPGNGMEPTSPIKTVHGAHIGIKTSATMADWVLAIPFISPVNNVDPCTLAAAHCMRARAVGTPIPLM